MKRIEEYQNLSVTLSVSLSVTQPLCQGRLDLTTHRGKLSPTAAAIMLLERKVDNIDVAIVNQNRTFPDSCSYAIDPHTIVIRHHHLDLIVIFLFSL